MTFCQALVAGIVKVLSRGVPFAVPAFKVAVCDAGSCMEALS